MARKTSILYFIDHIDGPGGTERHLSYLATMLDKARFDCAIVVFDLHPNALVDSLVGQGVEIHHIPVARYYGPNALRKAFTIGRLIRRKEADVVQTYHYKSDIYASLIAWLCGVRHIVSSKRDVAQFKKPFHFAMHRLIRPLIERYIVVSDRVADVVARKEGVDRRKMVKIYNGVDLERYPPASAADRAAARSRLGFAPDALVIGMVAWLRPEKDHQLLLEAFRQLRQRGIHAKLVLAGEGPLLNPSRQWVEAHGLSRDVVFTGLLSDVRPVVAAFDVACLVPKGNEGFSNSIIEKMALGLPLVVTDVGGNREAVEHGLNGFVIPPGALDRLVENLALLCTDRALRERMGAESRRRVERLFSLRHMIEQHEQLYESLVSGASPHA